VTTILPFLVDGDPSKRLGFLGATDIAALLTARDDLPYFSGAGEWKTWASQKHPELIAPPSPETQARWDLGHHLEPYVVERFHAESTDGLSSGGTGYVYSPAHPFMRAQLDDLILQEARVVGPMDAKATEVPWDWFGFERRDGEWVRTEILPDGYDIQGRVQLGMLRMACQAHGLPLPELAVYAGLDLTGAPMLPIKGGGVSLDLDRAPLMVREIEHDEDRWRDIYWYAVRWWEQYIVGDDEPADDDNKCCQRWRLHEKTRGLGEREATAEELALLEQRVVLKERRKSDKSEIDTLGARVAATMEVPKIRCGGNRWAQIQRSGASGVTLKEYNF